MIEPTELLIVVPASLRDGGKLPRKVLRPLAGRPLLEHALTTAAEVVRDRRRILVLTDDDEVALLAERLGCTTIVDERLEASGKHSDEVVYDAVMASEQNEDIRSAAVMLLRPSAPMVIPADLTHGLCLLHDEGWDSVLSATEETHHTWARMAGRFVSDFGGTARHEPLGVFYRETGAFLITRRDAISPASFIGDRIGLAVIPGSRAIDITSPHEWWICERLKQKRKIVFVVAGDTTTGMGHIYRSLQIAHEINNHEVAFVCIPESRLAHDMISSNGYSSVLAPADGVLSDVVLSEFPDMVVNDMLDTSAEYVSALRTAGARVVNFEDLGPGADEADLVINELYMEETPKSNHRVGPEFFCIREEFLSARPSVWRADPGEILLTFGGTDSENLTARVLRVIWPEAERRRVRVSVVTGFGYEHAAGLERLVGEIGSSRIQVANGTKRMSEFMGRVDLAFSSSGRTLFELATMRVPSIVIACNEREERHPFASSSAGFRYLGRHDRVRDEVIRRAFVEILDSADIRRRMYDSLSRLDFRNGKQRVLDAFSAVLGIPMR